MNRKGLTNDSTDAPATVRRRRPRLEGFDYRGRSIYHITIVTHQRQPFLIGDLARLVCSNATESAQATQFDVLAYCVMPDHCHLLVQGQDDTSDLLKFVKSFKQSTAFAGRRSFGAKFWQQSFHDRILRKTEDAKDVARYIVENPVEAGLISDAHGWLFSGGALVAPDGDGPEGSSLRLVPQ